MLSIDAEPRLDRQFSPAGLVLLWRDRAGGGGREGLFLLPMACPFPWCPDRHVDLGGQWVDGSLAAVELHADGPRAIDVFGRASRPRAAFLASVDLDQGRLDNLEPATDAAALAWVCRELEGELLTFLRNEFSRARAATEAALEGLAAGRRARFGRNEPCPCGSGLKYKRCCQGVAQA